MAGASLSLVMIFRAHAITCMMHDDPLQLRGLLPCPSHGHLGVATSDLVVLFLIEDHEHLRPRGLRDVGVQAENTLHSEYVLRQRSIHRCMPSEELLSLLCSSQGGLVQVAREHSSHLCPSGSLHLAHELARGHCCHCTPDRRKIALSLMQSACDIHIVCVPPPTRELPVAGKRTKDTSLKSAFAYL